jgi:hypothetical protein
VPLTLAMNHSHERCEVSIIDLCQKQSFPQRLQPKGIT